MATRKKKRPPRGRPVLPDTVARRTQLKVLMTSAESAMLDELAERLGLTQSDVVRRALLAAYTNPDLVTPRYRLTPELPEVLRFDLRNLKDEEDPEK